MKLVNGKHYQADLRLGFFEKLASNQTIVDKLTAVGFDEVVVSGSGRDRSASGIWLGDTSEVELPPQVVNVKEI